MAFKIITGSAFIITGLVSELMGLLFVIAAAGMTSRLIAAGIFFFSGLPLLIYGFKLFRLGMLLRPELIREALLKTAAMHHGELTKETITGAAGWNDIVIYELNDMIKNRIAKIEEKDGVSLYIFPEFQFKYVQNKCPFCGNDYPVRDDVQKCPSCGGDLKFLQVKSSSGKENFSMDS